MLMQHLFIVQTTGCSFLQRHQMFDLKLIVIGLKMSLQMLSPNSQVRFQVIFGQRFLRKHSGIHQQSLSE